MNRIEQMQFVADNAEHVKINITNLKNYSDTLTDLTHIHWLNDYKDKFTEKELILFSFINQSMNFCFWQEPYFYKEYEGITHKKSTAMFYALLDEALNNSNFLNLNYLKELKLEDLGHILNVDTSHPMLINRYNNLMETINVIYSNSNFYKELFEMKSTKEFYDYIMKNFASFRDISYYKDIKIDFYKRATLLINDLYEVTPTIKENIGSSDELLACADYGIPRTFKHYSVLEYSTELEEKINNKELIDYNSIYEIEIRAVMLYAVELIKNHLHSRNIKINSITLDNIIWATGREINEPHHLTVTIFY